MMLNNAEGRKQIGSVYKINVPQFINYLKQNQDEFFKNAKEEILKKHTGETLNKELEKLQTMRNILNDDEKIKKVLGSVGYHIKYYATAPGKEPLHSEVLEEILLNSIHKGYKAIKALENIKEEDINKITDNQKEREIIKDYQEKLLKKKNGTFADLQRAYRDLNDLGLIKD